MIWCLFGFGVLCFWFVLHDCGGSWICGCVGGCFMVMIAIAVMFINSVGDTFFCIFARLCAGFWGLFGYVCCFGVIDVYAYFASGGF